MFIQLVGRNPAGAVNAGAVNEGVAANLFALHPEQILAMIERIWAIRQPVGLAGQNTGLPEDLYDALQGIKGFQPLFYQDTAAIVAGLDPFPLHHLIYAYLIENTKVFEVFRKVIYAFRHGEDLGSPSPQSDQWMRITETLFFKETPSNSIHALDSYIRPDFSATRRNAYYRMFGLDLLHGLEGGKTYVKPKIHNDGFKPNGTFEMLLAEVNEGIKNASNPAKASAIDNAAINRYVLALGDSMRDRRQGGNLAREEYFAIVMMSWFHLTLTYDSPIIVDMRATASTPGERLRLLANKVQAPIHAKAQEFINLAIPMSWLLRELEDDITPSPLRGMANAWMLYNIGSPLQNTMRGIIANWSDVTGRHIKKLTDKVSIG
ncbi:hypothetical protein JYU03_00170 [bacterium AH-315-F03]|nr:hypothetical protein [bacterium AH-315-F03]